MRKTAKNTITINLKGMKNKPHSLKTLRMAVQSILFAFDIKYLIKIPINLLWNVEKSKSTSLHLENISQMVICTYLLLKLISRIFSFSQYQRYFVKSFSQLLQKVGFTEFLCKKSELIVKTLISRNVKNLKLISRKTK